MFTGVTLQLWNWILLLPQATSFLVIMQHHLHNTLNLFIYIESLSYLFTFYLETLFWRCDVYKNFKSHSKSCIVMDCGVVVKLQDVKDGNGVSPGSKGMPWRGFVMVWYPTINSSSDCTLATSEGMEVAYFRAAETQYITLNTSWGKWCHWISLAHLLISLQRKIKSHIKLENLELFFLIQH